MKKMVNKKKTIVREMPEINNFSEFYGLKVKNMMDKRFWDLPIVSKKDDIRHILRLLRHKSHVWVVENMKTRTICGVITEHDVLDLLQPRSPPTHMFGPLDMQRWNRRYMKDIIMCGRLVVVHPEDTIEKALLKMKRHGFRRLPIVKDGKLIGEVTLHTLLNRYCDIIQKNEGEGISRE